MYGREFANCIKSRVFVPQHGRFAPISLERVHQYIVAAQFSTCDHAVAELAKARAPKIGSWARQVLI